MASTIITRVISAANENVLNMSNSSWARPIALPSTWSKVRLGFRLHFIPSAAVTSGTSFGLGLCSGTTALLGDLTTTNFVGLLCNAGVAPSGGQVTSTFVPATKVGTALTVGAGVLACYWNVSTTGTDDTFEMLFVDVTKGSPNYTLQCFGFSVNGGSTNVSQAQFLAQVVAATPAFTGHTYTGGTTVAASEAAGVFNAVTAWWSDTVVKPEIADMAVVLLA